MWAATPLTGSALARFVLLLVLILILLCFARVGLGWVGSALLCFALLCQLCFVPFSFDFSFFLTDAFRYVERLGVLGHVVRPRVVETMT